MGSALRALSSRKIFFAHQSVGDNILSGVQLLAAVWQHEGSLTVRELAESDSLTEPGLYHAKIGNNGAPFTKIEGFREVLCRGDRGKGVDIALMKFCYADIDKGTDVEALFSQYGAAMAALRKRFPRLAIIHVTVPLTVHAGGMRSAARNLLLGDRANVKRNQYNALVRSAFSGREPLFDLADAESERETGRYEVFRFKGSLYRALSPTFSADGGHLNGAGRQALGLAFLSVLGDLAG